MQFTPNKMPSTTPDIDKMINILIRCYNRMKATFRLPAISRSEKLPSDLVSGPAFDKFVRICLDLSGMPFTDDKKDAYGHDELFDFINYWCSNSMCERLSDFSPKKTQSAEHLLDEFNKLLKMTADLREEVIDFQHIASSETAVRDVRQQLFQMNAETRYKIAQLIDESTDKMKQMHMDYEEEEKRLQPMVSDLREQLAVCESAFKSELMDNQVEIGHATELLRGAIDNYDKGMTQVYRKLLQLNEKIEKQQQTNDRLNEALAHQVAFYNRVLEEQQRIWSEKLESFRKNHSTHIS